MMDLHLQLENPTMVISWYLNSLVSFFCHLIYWKAGTIKDTITRYAHQTGHNVPRRFGWDCHGLPIEFEIDKQKGIKTKEDVLNFGIANYNEACRSIVMTYSEYWRTFVTRLGRWIDFDNGISRFVFIPFKF